MMVYHQYSAVKLLCKKIIKEVALCLKDCIYYIVLELLSELHLMSHTIYINNTNMTISLLQKKQNKRGENQYRSGHIDSCRSVKGELVLLAS